MKSAQVAHLAISDNGFVFDPTTGFSYNTNELGLHLLRLMQEGRTRQEIVSHLMETYEVTTDYLERDLEFFVLQMKSLSLMGE